MKYGFIRTHQKQFRVASLCRVLRVSRSGFYEWRAAAKSARAQANEHLLGEIRRVHHAHLRYSHKISRRHFTFSHGLGRKLPFGHCLAGRV